MSAIAEQDAGFKATLAAYQDAGRPRTVCPCCGGWQGLTLPICTDAGWLHHESCARIRYSDALCCRCEDAIGDPR